MKIQVIKSKTTDKFCLYIDEEFIMQHIQLRPIVQKIEAYLKLRFLPEEEGGIMGKLGGYFK